MLPMWPALPGFQIEAIDQTENEYVLVARATAKVAKCPKCNCHTSAVHSWYERKPDDLPSSGNIVRLRLKVRRFFCTNDACPRKIFCERLPQLIDKYARRTQRLVTSLTALALALGGKAGERIAAKLSMPAGRDTLLRFIRRQADGELPAPQAIGVDDWAFRKSHTYGTLLCDLEQGNVIDLLPDREAETLANWLKAHPTVRIVARDRSQTYAAGVAAAAPSAIQVADRWHLANNLVDAVEASLAKHPGRLIGGSVQVQTATAVRGSPSEDNEKQTDREDMLAARGAKRTLRKARYEQMKMLRQRGLKIKDIAAQVGISSRTVNRWIAHGTFPERKPRAAQQTILDPFRAYVRRRWQEGCHNCAQIHRELKRQGYSGSYSTVYENCRNLRRRIHECSEPGAPNMIPSPRRRCSPRQVAFLFIRQPDRLTETKQADLEVILRENSRFQPWYELAQQFMTHLRERDLRGLDAWLADAAKAGSGPIKRFASGLRKDYPEVAAAFTYKWSNGPTEGYINKLKLLKRQMYGRAKLDLLRKRLLSQN